MRHRWVLALLLVTAASGGSRAEAGPKPPPPPGIRWETSLVGARERALREGRPLLVCVNALEDQVSTLVTQHYPSEAWGHATRSYVCLVANQGDHQEKDGACPRFGGMPCSCHRDTLDWVVRSFADANGDIISPSHLILEPDGGLAFREDFFDARSRTGPALFETVLSAVAPDLALRIAGIDREADIAEIVRAPAEPAGELAREWLAQTGDGLATAGLLSALIDTEAPAKRLVLIAAFAGAPGAQVPVLVPTLEGVTAVPDERPDETIAWLVAVLRADREIGVWAAARAVVRAEKAALRGRVLEAWTGAKDAPAGAALPPGERAALAEALKLAGQKVAPELGVDDTEGTAMVPLARRTRARLAGTTGSVPLPGDLPSLAPGALRAALLGAAGDDVVKRKADVLAVLRGSPYLRVRIAAARALLFAGEGADGLVERTLLEGVFDPVEGPETRVLAVGKMHLDLGEDREAWAHALHDLLTGAR